MYCTDTFGTSLSGLLIQVVSEYMWPLAQVSLYGNVWAMVKLTLRTFYKA